jgi:hypothetical protein
MNREKFAERFFHKRFRNQPSGFPIAGIAYNGPDDQTATKVSVGIVDQRDEVIELKRWLVRAQDVRIDRAINNEILAFIKSRMFDKWHWREGSSVARTKRESITPKDQRVHSALSERIEIDGQAN